MSEIVLDQKQTEAIDDVMAFLEHSNEQIFRLYGAAGTGKSTLIQWMLDNIPYETYLGALSGKAVDVLRKKNMTRAQTLHSLLYKPITPDNDYVEDLFSKLNNARGNGERANIRAELAQITALNWATSQTAKDIVERSHKETIVVIVDEASMVGSRLFEDLLALGVKVVAVGDPFQLPPVKDKPFLTAENPDVLLLEPHRQALESGVYRLADEIRKGNMPAKRSEVDCVVTNNPKVGSGEFMSQFTQTIVGKHVNRRRLNVGIRQARGFEGVLPNKGERLICTKNFSVAIGQEYEPVFNGQEMFVTDNPNPQAITSVPIPMAKTHEPEKQFVVNTYDGHFQDHYQFDQDRGYRDFRIKQELFEADFGRAITCHKAQGSEYPTVFVHHDGFGNNRDTAMAWLYTAVTRAQEGVVLYSPSV